MFIRDYYHKKFFMRAACLLALIPVFINSRAIGGEIGRHGVWLPIDFKGNVDLVEDGSHRIEGFERAEAIRLRYFPMLRESSGQEECVSYRSTPFFVSVSHRECGAVCVEQSLLRGIKMTLEKDWNKEKQILPSRILYQPARVDGVRGMLIQLEWAPEDNQSEGGYFCLPLDDRIWEIEILPEQIDLGAHWTTASIQLRKREIRREAYQKRGMPSVVLCDLECEWKFPSVFVLDTYESLQQKAIRFDVLQEAIDQAIDRNILRQSAPEEIGKFSFVRLMDGSPEYSAAGRTSGRAISAITGRKVTASWRCVFTSVASLHLPPTDRMLPLRGFLTYAATPRDPLGPDGWTPSAEELSKSLIDSREVIYLLPSAYDKMAEDQLQTEFPGCSEWLVYDWPGAILLGHLNASSPSEISPQVHALISRNGARNHRNGPAAVAVIDKLLDGKTVPDKDLVLVIEDDASLYSKEDGLRFVASYLELVSRRSPSVYLGILPPPPGSAFFPIREAFQSAGVSLESFAVPPQPSAHFISGIGSPVLLEHWDTMKSDLPLPVSMQILIDQNRWFFAIDKNPDQSDIQWESTDCGYLLRPSHKQIGNNHLFYFNEEQRRFLDKLEPFIGNPPKLLLRNEKTIPIRGGSLSLSTEKSCLTGGLLRFGLAALLALQIPPLIAFYLRSRRRYLWAMARPGGNALQEEHFFLEMSRRPVNESVRMDLTHVGTDGNLVKTALTVKYSWQPLFQASFLGFPFEIPSIQIGNAQPFTSLFRLFTVGIPLYYTVKGGKGQWTVVKKSPSAVPEYTLKLIARTPQPGSTSTTNPEPSEDPSTAGRQSTAVSSSRLSASTEGTKCVKTKLRDRSSVFYAFAVLGIGAALCYPVLWLLMFLASSGIRSEWYSLMFWLIGLEGTILVNRCAFGRRFAQPFAPLIQAIDGFGIIGTFIAPPSDPESRDDQDAA